MRTIFQSVLEAIRSDSYLAQTTLQTWLLDNRNWAVLGTFFAEADKVWASGRRRYSARTIGEYIRHHTGLQDGGTAYKVDDHSWLLLARLYIAMNPDRAGFFEIRNQKRS